MAGQWLALCTLTTKSLGSIPGQGIEIPQTVQRAKKEKINLVSRDPSKCTLVLVAFYRLFGIFLNTKSCYLWIDSLISFYQIYVPFISFSCFIALARMSSTLLNRNGESGHPCPDLSLGGKTFQSFTTMLLTVVWFLFFCRGPLSGWGSLLLFLICYEFFLSWMNIKFCQVFSLLKSPQSFSFLACLSF